MSAPEQIIPVLETEPVEKKTTTDYRDYIYIGLLIVISLIIALLLILAFAFTYHRMKSDDPDDEEDDEEEEEDEEDEDEDSDLLDQLEKELDEETVQIREDKRGMLKKIQPIDEVSSVDVSEA